MDGISIIICCHNSAHHLPRTLEALAGQQVPSNFPWEVIIVDNNSSDNTAEVAMTQWGTHNLHTTLRIVGESTPGLSFARAKGFSAAKHEFCLFCDDDNWLDPHYVRKAYEILKADDSIGVLGGRGKPVCEIHPPAWFEDLKGGYAVGKQSEVSGDITSSRGYVYGAGAVFRKSVYLMLREKGFTSLLSDRKGQAVSSGGDKELCYAYVLAGYKIFYADDLVFEHFIPKKKLTRKYLTEMYLGFSSAQAILNLYEYVLREIRSDNKVVRSVSLLWFKDVIYTFYFFLRSLKNGFLQSRMQMQVLLKILSLRGVYGSMYEQIASLKALNRNVKA